VTELRLMNVMWRIYDAPDMSLISCVCVQGYWTLDCRTHYIVFNLSDRSVKRASELRD
jgi:hypothetical protein